MAEWIIAVVTGDELPTVKIPIGPPRRRTKNLRRSAALVARSDILQALPGSRISSDVFKIDTKYRGRGKRANDKRRKDEEDTGVESTGTASMSD